MTSHYDILNLGIQKLAKFIKSCRLETGVQIIQLESFGDRYWSGQRGPFVSLFIDP